MKRAFDPITQTFLLGLFGLSVTLLYGRNKMFFPIGAVIILIALVRMGLIVSNKKGAYPGTVYNESEDTAACVLAETGANAVISPGMKMPADGVNTGVRPGKVYKLSNGTNVRIGKNGQVSAYSPVSALVNPGWVDMEYFDKRKALTEEWKQLFNCN